MHTLKKIGVRHLHSSVNELSLLTHGNFKALNLRMKIDLTY